MWTAGSVRKLQRKMQLAQARILHLVEDNAISTPRGLMWGQFLYVSRRDEQVGIYGTSSAIQILAEAHREDLLQHAVQAPGFFAVDTKGDLVDTKGDLVDTYKLIFLAHATDPCRNVIDAPCGVMDALVDRRLADGGWREFPDDRVPHVLATAMALVALHRYSRFNSTADANQSLDWLARALEQDDVAMLETERAYGVLALMHYSRKSDVALRRLSEWASRRRGRDFDTAEWYVYPINHNGRTEHKYLFFIPDVVAAIAATTQGDQIPLREYALRVARHVTQRVLETGHGSTTTHRASTVDHMWLYKMLGRLVAMSVRDLVPPSIVRWTGQGFWGITVRILFGVIVALTGFWIAWTYETSGALNILGNLIGGIGLAWIMAYITGGWIGTF